jgi:phosphoribosylglycinamide formyltransferase-1
VAAPVVVLVSGGGTNLQALLDAAAAGAAFEVRQVVADREGAFALERARRAGVATTVVPRRAFADRAGFERALAGVLAESGAEWAALAGFMRVLGPELVERWRDRMVNIHPSLLPAFRGLHTHRRVLEAGLRVTGCTVHVVRAELDDGPIVVQAAVPVLADDSEDSLAARVLAQEHRAYPLALDLLASGRAVVDGERVRLTAPAAAVPEGFLWPSAGIAEPRR